MSIGQTTLLQVRTLIRQLTNTENSQIVTDAELNSYINLDYQELYGLLVMSYGDNYYFQTPYQFTTDGTSLLYPLPTDFFKLRGVDLSLTGAANSFVTLKQFNFRERNRLNNAFIPSPSINVLQNVRYELNGGKIMLTPLAQAAQIIQIWYIPRCPNLSLDSDILDGVNGWEQYVIASVAQKVAVKQEEDYSPFSNQKAFLLARIKEEAAQRNAGDPSTVSDVYSDGWEF